MGKELLFAICDDEPEFQKRLLEKTVAYLEIHKIKYSIDVYLNGTELLNSPLTYDIVLLDVQMDGMDGMETAMKLKKRNDNTLIILSNALNNAIEACKKVQGQRWIYVQMITRNGQFLISVKNPVERPVKITDNQIATTESDKLWHGIGLTNVQAVTRQNHGHMFLTCKDKIFHFLAVFNLE